MLSARYWLQITSTAKDAAVSLELCSVQQEGVATRPSLVYSPWVKQGERHEKVNSVSFLGGKSKLAFRWGEHLKSPKN